MFTQLNQLNRDDPTHATYLPQMSPEPLNAPYEASSSALPAHTRRRGARGAVRRKSGRSLRSA